MPEQQTKDIIDIKDRNEAFKQTNNQLNALTEGFYALALDYGYHIENIHGGNHRIIELRDNVIYRLFSSLLHCQLLLQQHIIIESRLKEIYKSDPGKILNYVYPKNPNFEYAEKEISAIFDSVVFHLSAIYDYLGILINFLSAPMTNINRHHGYPSQNLQGIKIIAFTKTRSPVKLTK